PQLIHGLGYLRGDGLSTAATDQASTWSVAPLNNARFQTHKGCAKEHGGSDFADAGVKLEHPLCVWNRALLRGATDQVLA
ncbi:MULTISPECIES: hypothetical protein, partial [unclassified Mesorhizobium]|uniref:hypothetical protein n=1 Tax=unclassified Mesorhizobium TaxID=325217 RepID=UPI001AED7912